MGNTAISELVQRRMYAELEGRAEEYIETDDWRKLLDCIDYKRNPSSKGKSRDALVSLLQLETVGGTDSDIFQKFRNLEGASLQQIRASAREKAIEVLKDQIQDRHTYFLDVDAMALTPYAILVKDVIEARKLELEQLGANPSRIEVLGTFYGFAILMTEGAKHRESQTNAYGYRYWRRRTWLDEDLTDTAVNAIKLLTGELAEEVDMDKTYKTLGSSRIFKGRCTKTTADILANAVRLSFYKMPGNRTTAARQLGRTEDSRTLPFLHHRLGIEENRRVRMGIVDALGSVGHESSIDLLKERAKLAGRRWVTKESEAATEAIGRIYSPICRKTLVEILKEGGNTVKATAIEAIARQEEAGLVDLISPYLVHNSRPVVRASVLALMGLGQEGRAAIREKAPTIIKRIGTDRPSRVAFGKMMTIRGIGKTKSVHRYFAKQIMKHARRLHNWQRRRQRSGYTSSTYYYNHWDNRLRKRVSDSVQLANQHLQQPYDDELVQALTYVSKIDDDPRSGLRSYVNRMLAEVPKEKPSVKDRFVQTFLDAHR